MDAGIRFSPSGVEYLWFRDGGRLRLLRLFRLSYIPVSYREDPDVLGKAWAMLRGLYAARVDFAYLAAGIWTPRPIGVVQFYGAVAEGEADEEALREELTRRSAAVVAAFRAAYPQSRLAPAGTEDLRWLLEAITSFPHAVALLGQPSPRAAPKGLGRDGQTGARDEEFASQQNEILFRGLAALRKDFLFVFLADRMERGALTRQLERIAREAGMWASRARGQRTVGFSIGIPIVGAVARAASAAHAYGTGETDSSAHTVSRSHTESQARSWAVTDSYARSEGGFEGWGESESWGSSWSRAVSHADSRAETVGTADTVSRSETASWARTSGSSTSTTTSVTHVPEVRSVAVGSGWTSGSQRSVEFSAGTAHTTGSGTSFTVGRTESTSGSTTHTTSESLSASVDAGVQIGVPGVASASFGAGGSRTVGASLATSSGWSAANSSSSTASTSSSHTVSSGSSHGFSQSTSVSGSRTVTVVPAHDIVSTSTSTSSFSSETIGRAETVGTARTESRAETKGTTDATTEAWGTFQAYSRSHSWGRSWSETWGHAVTRGETRGTADTVGTADTTGRAEGVSRGQQVGGAETGAWSFGLVPSWSVSRTWQVEEDQIDQVARLLRLVEAQLERAAAEGAYRGSAYLLVREEEALRAAAALAVEAFHGADVPTPVVPAFGRCAAEHARRLEPCRCPDPLQHPLGGSAAGTVLTFEQAAAYAAPGLFEEGSAVTMQEALPPLAFYPPEEDGILVGLQYSPETGDLTDTPLVIPRARYSHAAFLADTRFGKSVAAMRMALESTAAWHMRTVVLDFGAGWRALLVAPRLAGRVDFYSLSPGGPRPLRWNPLQVGRRIHPEVQWRAFCDVFGAVARLGVRRQIGELRDALRRVYLDAGVLVDDPALPPAWRRAREDEEEVLARARAERGLPQERRAGLPLEELEPFERQALAAHRSRRVGLADLYAALEERLRAIPARDATLRGVVEGILYRLHPLVQGAAARQYAPGEDTVEIEEIAMPWGLAVIEGGADLDEFSKAFLLGWMGWRLWRDMVARRQAGGALQPMQIFFEEANKIFNGPQAPAEEEGGGSYVAEQFAVMWRDSAKYGCYLHVIAQSPSLLPRGILSSCSIVFIGQLKDPEDARAAMALLERSEAGFVDEPYRRLIRRLGVGQFLVRLAYGEMSRLEPVLTRPLMVVLPEPTDEEILSIFGRRA